mmetsp:Transcript_16269/g.32491  ORF Transcript_16269/g.32491 Transcript_16269/m.32491 type:complete len:141 (+) Transcript_16269:457-879(+)
MAAAVERNERRDGRAKGGDGRNGGSGGVDDGDDDDANDDDNADADKEDDEEEEETKVEKEREEARSRSRSLSNGGRGRDEKGTTNWPRRRWGGDGRRRSRARWTHWRIIFVWTRGGGFRLSPYLQGFLGGMDGEDGCTWE